MELLEALQLELINAITQLIDRQLLIKLMQLITRFK